jgi:hypothetical protein
MYLGDETLNMRGHYNWLTPAARSRVGVYQTLSLSGHCNMFAGKALACSRNETPSLGGHCNQRGHRIVFQDGNETLSLGGRCKNERTRRAY